MRNLAVQPWLLFVTLLLTTRIASQPASQLPEQGSQDLAVFKALLNDPEVAGDAFKYGVVLISDVALSPSELELFAPDREEYVRHSLHTPSPHTIDQFLKVVRQSGELPAALSQVPGVVLVQRAELARLLEAPGRDYWQTFEREYPHARGTLSFSAIAYGPNVDEVLAYTAFSCGMICGHGLAVVLQHRDGNWVAVEHLTLWES